MKRIYDTLSFDISTIVTKRYSTSFSLSILLLPRKLRKAIYAIYGYVRVADEIVDSFLGYNQQEMLDEWRLETDRAIDRKISTNPILHCFQDVVHEYNIDQELIDAFLHSMEMDLHKSNHTPQSYQEYIYGSAEVVGLMCLKVFLNGNQDSYEALKPYAKSLGAAFQKVNFLRDLNHDFTELDRAYFPNIDISNMDSHTLDEVCTDIQKDFDQALIGLQRLPKSSRCAVYIAYKYYLRLFKKIKGLGTQKVLEQRIRIPNLIKVRILFSSYLRHKLNLI